MGWLSKILQTKFPNLINKKVIFISVICGLASYLLIYTKINFLIPGTGASTDPREIINTLGSAFTGPIGAIVIGVISSLADNPEIKTYVVINHIITAFWIGIAYKKIVYERFTAPWQILIWAALIVGYYTVFYYPIFILTYFYYPDISTELVGTRMPLWDSIKYLFNGWLMEMIFSTIFTSLVLIALPQNLLKPLWGSENKAIERSALGVRKSVTRFTKAFEKNYLGIRLSIWFILLASLTLAFGGIIIKNHFVDYVAEENAFHLVEYAKLITQSEKDTLREDSTNLDSNLPVGVKSVEINKDDLGKCKSADILPLKLRLSSDEIDFIGKTEMGYIFKDEKDVIIAFAKTNNNEILFLVNKGYLPLSTENELINSIYKNVGITILIISLATGLIIWMVVAIPIKKFTHTANEVAKGNYDIQLDESMMTDEIKLLAAAFNQMITNINSTKKELIDKHNEVLLAKQEAEASNRLKTEFLAQMSHEIRTPLHHILSYASILRENLGSKASALDESCLRIIEESGRRITRTIDMILNMSQLSLGLYHPNLSRFDLIEDVLYMLVNEFQSSADSKNLSLKLESEEAHLIVSSDRFCIVQILDNLMNNAIKFTKQGEVKIAVRKLERMISIDVIDTGIGISEEYLKTIFEPFSQEEQGYNRSFEGNGLGLALVKNYCSKIKGEIKVESQKDRGTKFTLIFPIEINEFNETGGLQPT